MKRIILLLSTLVMAGFVPLSAQTAAFNGFCTNGGKSATVNGLTSSNKLEQIIPSCTVSVYLTGTTTLAPAIYKDAINTPLPNPFTADNLSAIAPGKWLFFAPVGQGYDVVMSGGIAPLTFSSPVTLTDLLVGGGGGGGGGCTPIGLNGVLQASNGVGGCTPAYVQVNGTNLVTPTAPNFIDTATVKVINPGTNQIGFNGVSSSPTIQHNDVTLAGNFSAGTSQILDFNDTTPTPPAGYVNAIFQPDTVTGRLSAYVPSPAGTFVQQLPDPLGTQHVIIYPTGMSTSGTPGNNYGTLTSGLVQTVPQCSGTNNGVISWTYTGALAAQAPWVVPANVTAVYAFGYGGLAVSNTGNNCAPGPNPAPVNYGAGILDNGGRTLMIVNTPTPIFSATELTVLTGATIDTTVGSASISSSGATQSNPFFSVSLLGLIVYYTGTPPPANNAIQIAPPLQYSNATGQPILSLDSTFPQSLSAYSVLKLPPANNYVGRIVSVFDSTDCVTQTGTATSPNNTTCGPVLVGTNYVWAPTTGSGGGGAVSSVSNSDGTLTISPTTGAVVTSLALGHANTWTATQTFSNVKDTGAAAGSGTACLQIDTSGLLSNTGTTCGGGGGGGSNVKVNGGTALTTVNLNSTTPAAGALNQNLAFQVDGSGNTSVEVPYGSASNLGVVKVDGTTITASGGVISAPSNGPVCSGSITLAGATIPGSTAGTNQTVTCTGLLTTDNIMLDFNGSPLSTSGFVPASGGPITIVKYPSANTINVTPVNYNSSSVTLGSITLNYRVVRGGGGSGGGAVPINRIACTGCVADGNLAADTGTDNTTAFTNCLTAAVAAKAVCYVPPGVYRIATSMPSITTSGTGFVSDQWGLTSTVSGGTWSGPITQIFTSSASATILTATGGSGVITGDTVENIAWQRATTPATGSIGLLFNNTAGVSVVGNVVSDSSIGYDITYAPTYGGGVGFSNNVATWCYSGVVGPGSGPYVGFNMHGGANGFQTMFLNQNMAVNNCGASPTSYGFEADGLIRDLNMSNNQTALASYGVYFNGSAGSLQGMDVHVVDQTDDGYQVNGEYINFGGSGNSVMELSGGEASPYSTGSSYGTLITNSRGVSVHNRQYFGQLNAVHAIELAAGAAFNSIVDNVFLLSNNIAVVCNASNENNITGNIYNLSGTGGQFANLTNCSNNTIMGNTGYNGNSAAEILLDSSSNNNHYVNLNNVTSSSGISDSGSGNELPLGFTAGDDLSGTSSAQTVIGIQGHLLPTLAAGYPHWTGSAWVYDTPSGGAAAVPICSDTSGSGTAQSCTTSPTFTPGNGSCIAYTTTTTNTGSGLTLNVDASSAYSVAKWQGATTLAAGDVVANKMVLACLDSGNLWELSTIGNAPSGGGGGDFASLMSLVTVTGCTKSGGQCATTGSVPAITFASIPSTYQNLTLECVLQTSNGSGSNVNLTFNGDTGAHYDYQELVGNNGQWNTGGAHPTATTSILASFADPNTSSYGNPVHIEIPQYANTNWWKHVATRGQFFLSAGGGMYELNTEGGWESDSAITSVTITAGTSDNWLANSVCTLDGSN